MVLISTLASCTKDTEIIDETNSSIDLSLVNENDSEMSIEILDIINEHRTSIGLPKIEYDNQYASAYAVDHTKYMIEISDINHDNFNVRSQGLRDQGAASVGENVAYGYATATSLVHAWLNSPSHRSVIEGNYTHSGFGVIKNESGLYYFTQLFYRN